MRGFQNKHFYDFSITGFKYICILISWNRSFSYEISKGRYKISNFCVFKFGFKYLFCNISSPTWLEQFIGPFLNSNLKLHVTRKIK